MCFLFAIVKKHVIKDDLLINISNKKKTGQKKFFTLKEKGIVIVFRFTLV